jgi:hypothetical protein
MPSLLPLKVDMFQEQHILPGESFEYHKLKSDSGKAGFKITPEGFNFEIQYNIKYVTG